MENNSIKYLCEKDWKYAEFVILCCFASRPPSLSRLVSKVRRLAVSFPVQKTSGTSRNSLKK